MKKILSLLFFTLVSNAFSQDITQALIKYSNDNFEIKFTKAEFSKKDQTVTIDFLIENKKLANQTVKILKSDLSFNPKPLSKLIDSDGNEYIPNKIILGSNDYGMRGPSNDLKTNIPIKGKLIYNNIINCIKVRNLCINYDSQNSSDNTKYFTGEINIENFETTCNLTMDKTIVKKKKKK